MNKSIYQKSLNFWNKSKEAPNLIFVTGNQKKLEEAKKILEPSRIKVIGKELELEEPRSFDQTWVVLTKAKQAFDKLEKPLIVDDTAIYFEAYNNFPGTFTEYLFKAIGYEGILKLLEGKNKKAFVQSLICYIDSNQSRVFEGRLNGRITDKISDQKIPGLEFSSIFISEGCNRYLSEIYDIKGLEFWRKTLEKNCRVFKKFLKRPKFIISFK